MKKIAAAYQSSRGGLAIWSKQKENETDDETDAWFKDYIRVTEFVEIEFPDLAKEVITNNQIAVIDGLIESETEKMLIVIDSLKQRKAELLAITFQGDS